MEVINQGSTYPITLTFKDGNGNNVTPSAGRYRIDVEGGNSVTGNNANAWIDFTPANSTYDLIVTANQNGLNSNNSVDREERVVTVEFTYGANAYKQTDEYRYMIRVLENLLDVP